MQLRADAALLDIEGTVGSIAFVHEVLFPYARERLDSFVKTRRNEAAVRAALDDAAREGHADAADLPGILRVLHAWMDADVKVTPLKELQGMIWAEGFESGALIADLYDDAIDALRRYHLAGIRLFIYSSGSVQAQKVLFGHTIAGDLTPLFDGYFDTATGPKRDPQSYRTIAQVAGVAPERMVFFSDACAELEAARAAGLQTVQLAREEDGVEPVAAFDPADSFSGIDLER